MKLLLSFILLFFSASGYAQFLGTQGDGQDQILFTKKGGFRAGLPGDVILLRRHLIAQFGFAGPRVLAGGHRGKRLRRVLRFGPPENAGPPP